MKKTKWERIAVLADRFAPPFWIILILYGVYELWIGIMTGYIPLIIGSGALLVDTTFIIKNRDIS